MGGLSFDRAQDETLMLETSVSLSPSLPHDNSRE